jgi:hypothetical protein
MKNIFLINENLPVVVNGVANNVSPSAELRPQNRLDVSERFIEVEETTKLEQELQKGADDRGGGSLAVLSVELDVWDSPLRVAHHADNTELHGRKQGRELFRA